MSEIHSDSFGKDWMRANSDERRKYLTRASLRLARIGVEVPSFSVLEQRITEITSQLSNADLDVGRMFEQAIEESRQARQRFK